jgi:hypothetical protein
MQSWRRSDDRNWMNQRSSVSSPLKPQIVSLTGWLVSSDAGAQETANCGDATFHDWHLEIFEHFGNHVPRIGDPTPIICEITPRTEKSLYDWGIRIQCLASFFRLPDNSYAPDGASGAASTDYRLPDVG